MEIFERVYNNKYTIANITFVDNGFSTKDLYLSNIVLIDFYIGQELYFYVVKSCLGFVYANDNSPIKKGEVITTMEIFECPSGLSIYSIDYNSLKNIQFIQEKRNINKFIKNIRR